LGELDGILSRVEATLRELQAGGRTEKTLQNHAETLRSFCTWRVDRGYLAGDRFNGLEQFDTTPKTTRRAMVGWRHCPRLQPAALRDCGDTGLA